MGQIKPFDLIAGIVSPPEIGTFWQSIKENDFDFPLGTVVEVIPETSGFKTSNKEIALLVYKGSTSVGEGWCLSGMSHLTFRRLFEEISIKDRRRQEFVLSACGKDIPWKVETEKLKSVRSGKPLEVQLTLEDIRPAGSPVQASPQSNKPLLSMNPLSISPSTPSIPTGSSKKKKAKK